jgi:uncharacterized protein YggE
MPARCLLFLLSLFSLLTLTEPLLAEERAPPMRTLALVGSGEVRAKPDIALINVGVTIRAPTAREALMQNTTAMNDIVDYLKQADVDAKDIQTSSFTVNPAYVYDNQGKEPPKIVGYDVSNVLTLTVRKLSALGEILDRASPLRLPTCNPCKMRRAAAPSLMLRERPSSMRKARGFRSDQSYPSTNRLRPLRFPCR